MENKYPNIEPNKHYKNARDGRVFTGQQVLNLLEIADEKSPVIAAILLLEIQETSETPTNPKSRYGLD